MSKHEFLEQLRDYLSEQLPENAVRGHIDYYKHYIENEIRGGRREAAVISELGDPRLLGRTIIDAGTAAGSYHEGGTRSDGYDRTAYTDRDLDAHGKKTKSSHSSISSFAGKLKVILIIALILAVLFFIIRFAVRLLIYILPVIIVLSVISYFVKRR